MPGEDKDKEELKKRMEEMKKLMEQTRKLSEDMIKDGRKSDAQKEIMKEVEKSFANRQMSSDKAEKALRDFLKS